MKNTPRHHHQYNYSDYLTWDDGRRWELIHGVLFEFVLRNGMATVLLLPIQGTRLLVETYC